MYVGGINVNRQTRFHENFLQNIVRSNFNKTRQTYNVLYKADYP